MIIPLLKKLYDLILGQLNATVGDGLKTYMGLFFAQHSYQVLDEQINANYIMLIELFQVIENFLSTLKRGLDILERNSRRLIPQILNDRTQVKMMFNICFKKLHEFLQAHHEIRDRCHIDFLMAQERDKMADESGEDESSDYSSAGGGGGH